MHSRHEDDIYFTLVAECTTTSAPRARGSMRYLRRDAVGHALGAWHVHVPKQHVCKCLPFSTSNLFEASCALRSSSDYVRLNLG
jgi:hypothetical protein